MVLNERAGRERAAFETERRAIDASMVVSVVVSVVLPGPRGWEKFNKSGGLCS